MGISAGGSAFELQFAISPLMLSGGIASAIPGGVIPAVFLSDAIGFASGLIGGSSNPTLDDFPLRFQPLPGGTLISQQIGMYPFANQAVAANATIQQPRAISMLMYCLAGRGGGYNTRLAMMQSLQQSFDQHNKSGGLYNLMTPVFVYTNLIMTDMTDISRGDTHQVQNCYKLDFLQPLVTQQQAQQAQNALMSAISNGTQTDGSQTGAGSLAGSSSGGMFPGFSPSTTNQGAAGISSDTSNVFATT